MTRPVYLLLSLLLYTLCIPFNGHAAPRPRMTLTSVNIIDKEGFSSTVKSKERLKEYTQVNWLQPQPYKQVLRVYSVNNRAGVMAFLTSYHDNSQLKEYLEIRNRGAYGTYRDWHENGQLRTSCYVIGGTPEFTTAAKQTWQFDGPCYVYDDCGNQIALLNYCKGSQEGDNFQYYCDGQLKQRTFYCRSEPHGRQEMFYPSGIPMADATWEQGNLCGPAHRWWDDGSLAFEEEYEDNLLISGRYYDRNHQVVADITDGNGHRSIFGPCGIQELHEYRNGKPHGEVKQLNELGQVTNLYHVKNGMKHGEEIQFYPPTIEERKRKYHIPSRPRLLITWHEDKVQGTTKTWYENGSLESQREMANNSRSGLAMAWYADGSLMLVEEYDQDKLVKGEYFRQGQKNPESTVTDGSGLATLYDPEGQLISRVTYFHGIPID